MTGSAEDKMGVGESWCMGYMVPALDRNTMFSANPSWG